MLKLKVEGMTCGHCVGAVTAAVREIVPDAEVNVSLASGDVTVASEHVIPAEKVAAAIADEGYNVKSLAA
jgi:copper chaperone